MTQKTLITCLVASVSMMGCSEAPIQSESQPKAEPVQAAQTEHLPPISSQPISKPIVVDAENKPLKPVISPEDVTETDHSAPASEPSDAKDLTKALLTAIPKENLNSIIDLLNQGAGLEGRNMQNETPLMVAARSKRLDIVDYLLSVGANPNVKNKQGQTLLDLVLSQKEKDYFLFNRLLSSPQFVLKVDQTNRKGETLLFQAVKANQPETVKLLVSRGAKIDLAKQNGATPLIRAVYDHNLPMAKQLLTLGANPNLGDKELWTPLHYAVRKGHDDADMVVLLLNHGANPDLANKAGQPPFVFAIVNQGYQALNKLAPVSRKEVMDSQGRTPLMRAVIAQQMKVSEILLHSGANPNTQDKSRWTPLLVAVKANQQPLVELLIAQGADKDAQQSQGWSGLHFASADSKLIEMAQFMLKEGASTELTTEEGYTPMMLAVLYNNLPMVRLLVEEGAALNTSHVTMKKTALDFAHEKVNQALVNYLQSKGAVSAF